MKTPRLWYSIDPPLSNWASGVLLLCVLATPAFGLDFVSEGEKALALDNPAKALTYLEAALAQGTPSETLYMDLGLAYQRTGKSNEAQKSFRTGADLQGPLQKTFLLNLGVSQFLSQNWDGANKTYTELLTIQPDFPQGLLNRAQTRVKLEAWGEAASDYRLYQLAAPENPQKDKIDQVIALLEQANLDAEAARLAAETQKKLQAEAQAAAEAQAKADADAAAAKAAEEQKQAAAAAEAERQQQEEILAKIRESLAQSSEDSQSLSTGPSEVKTDDGDFSLEP